MPSLVLLVSLVVGMWSMSFSTSSSCPTNCTCHLELKFATCANNNLTTLPTAIPPSTEHLNLSLNQLTFVQHQAFRFTRRLRTLLLNDNKISAIADGAFSPLEALVKLDLSRNRISTLTKGFSLGLGSLLESCLPGSITS
ncbi:hypothetical protein NFI96_009774 [Prochilodus magdalenae]|nr:hypothetical protein NFI96_009774 [Prochilodus magdalenae]